MAILSNRAWHIVGIEPIGTAGETAIIQTTITFGQLTVKDSNDDTELLYALQDKGDELLDMKLGETMYIQTNRDNNQCKAVIARIK